MEPTAARPHMPGYGISSSPDGLLPFSWAEERLVSAQRYLVVTVAPDGAPHVMPVWAVWHDDALWFSSGGRSRKVRNLRSDPRCAVHVEAHDLLIVHGVAELLDETDEGMAAAYAAKYGEAPMDPAGNPIVRIAPTWAFGLVESAFTSSPTRWTF